MRVVGPTIRFECLSPGPPAPDDSVGELVTALAVSQPAASKHLRVLREAGLVRVTGAARRRIYSIDPAPLIELDAGRMPDTAGSP
jgi:DNA-binding transcriptional ArsR family regulator